MISRHCPGDRSRVSAMRWFDPELLKRLERVRLMWRSRRRPVDAGRCTDYRDYSPGDDYRCIDWRYCARRDELLVPRFVLEPADHVDLFLDCSRAMALAGRFAAARMAVAAIGYGALAGSQQAGVVAYSDRIVARFAAVRGRVRAGSLLAFLERLSADRASADLAAAAAVFVRGRRRAGRAVVVSGAHDPAGLQRGLEVLRDYGYRPAILRVYDPREAVPAVLGDVEIFDAETGRSWEVTLTEADVATYRRLYADHCEALRRYCASRAVRYAELAADLPEEQLLLRAMEEGGRVSP